MELLRLRTFQLAWSSIAALCLIVFCGNVPVATAQTFAVTPSSITFKNVTVGTIGLAYPITVQNTGTTPVVINSYSVSPSEFQFFYGWSPVTLQPNALINYSLRFAPSAAQTFNGQFIITIQGVTNPIVVPLTGTGVATAAKASISPGSLTFASLPTGTTSPNQVVTIKNVGTQNTTVNAITIDAPFQASGYTIPKVLSPGQSMAVNVNMFGNIPGTYNNVLTVGYNNLLTNGVALSGTITQGGSVFGITTYPTSPFAVQNGAYSAILSAVGGTPPYTWSLAAGSSLPFGLTLSSAGAITGTLGNVTLGTYSFTVNATDSLSNVSSLRLNIPAKAQTGAICNNIGTNITGTSSPLIALNDLGTGTYQGSQGGLYPNGSNVRPAAFDAAGVAVAQTIQPLDAAGNPDPVNGKIGLMSIGMSALFDTFLTFITDTYADTTVNPHVVLVPGAQPRAYASNFANPNDAFWNPIFQSFLPEYGVTAAQVQVAYVKDIDPTPHGTFPTDMAKLQSEYESIAQNLHAKFPNLKIAYFGGSVYTGYSNGLSNIDNEPWAYESGFAVKWAIQDQINGAANLNWDPTEGPVNAPWMAWGAYPWANGLLARKDGTVWSCPDIKYDGFHPSMPYGREKETNLMLNFFKSDDTSTPWFLAH